VQRHLELLLALLRWRLDFVHGLALCPGCQRLGLSGGCSLSLARGFDAGGILGQGWCSARDQQRSPSFVHVNAWGFDFPGVRVLGHASTSKRVDVFGERR
jgi:hypothetical protein